VVAPDTGHAILCDGLAETTRLAVSAVIVSVVGADVSGVGGWFGRTALRKTDGRCKDVNANIEHDLLPSGGRKAQGVEIIDRVLPFLHLGDDKRKDISADCITRRTERTICCGPLRLDSSFRGTWSFKYKGKAAALRPAGGRE